MPTLQRSSRLQFKQTYCQFVLSTLMFQKIQQLAGAPGVHIAVTIIRLRWFLRIRRIRLPPKIRNTARNTARIRAVARKRNGRIAVTYAKRNGCNPSKSCIFYDINHGIGQKSSFFVFFQSTFQFFCLKRILNFDFDLRGKSDMRGKSAELWYLVGVQLDEGDTKPTQPSNNLENPQIWQNSRFAFRVPSREPDIVYTLCKSLYPMRTIIYDGRRNY
jgi:hypothetical protein